MGSSRWSQIYNIYADKLLGTNLVDDVVCIQLAGQSVKFIAHTLQGEQKPSQILSISTWRFMYADRVPLIHFSSDLRDCLAYL